MNFYEFTQLLYSNLNVGLDAPLVCINDTLYN